MELAVSASVVLGFVQTTQESFAKKYIIIKKKVLSTALLNDGDQCSFVLYEKRFQTAMRQ